MNEIAQDIIRFHTNAMPEEEAGQNDAPADPIHPVNAHVLADRVIFTGPVENGVSVVAIAPVSSGRVVVEKIGKSSDGDLSSDSKVDIASKRIEPFSSEGVVVEKIGKSSDSDLSSDAKADIVSKRIEHSEAFIGGEICEERDEPTEPADSDDLVVHCEAGDHGGTDKIQQGAGSSEGLVVAVESGGGHSSPVGDEPEHRRSASPDLQKPKAQEATEKEERADNITGEATFGKPSGAEVHLSAGKRRKSKKKKSKKQALLTSIQRYLHGPGKHVSMSSPVSNSLKASKLAGAIFFCNRHTMEDCFRFRVFGLSWSQKDFVKRVFPGTILFLFEYEAKQLAGIYEAISHGGLNLEPAAFQTSPGSFPAQVFFRVIEQRPPLEEREFKAAIKDNYYSPFKFQLDLNSSQVDNLCTLFRGKSFASTARNFEVLPGSVPGCLEDIYLAHPVIEDAPGPANNMVYLPHDAAGNAKSNYRTCLLSRSPENVSRLGGIRRKHQIDFSSHGESTTCAAYDSQVNKEIDISCMASDDQISQGRLGAHGVDEQGDAVSPSKSADIYKRNLKEGRGTSILNSEVESGAILSPSLYCDKVDHKVSVWERISLGDTRSMITHIGAGGLARAMDSSEKGVYPRATDESSSEEEFNISTLDSCFPSDCIEHDYTINFKRRKKPSFAHGLERFDGIQLKKRRKIVRPDFSCSVTSVHSQRLQVPQKDCISVFNNVEDQVARNTDKRPPLDYREMEQELQRIETDHSFAKASIGVQQLERSCKSFGKTTNCCVERHVTMGEHSCLEGYIPASEKVPVSLQFMDLDLTLSLRKGNDGSPAPKDGIISKSQFYCGMEMPCASRDKQNLGKNGFLTSPNSSEGVDLDLRLCLHKVF